MWTFTIAIRITGFTLENSIEQTNENDHSGARLFHTRSSGDGRRRFCDFWSGYWYLENGFKMKLTKRINGRAAIESGSLTEGRCEGSWDARPNDMSRGQ